MRSLGPMHWLFLLSLLFFQPRIMAQDIKVLVLDALSGKPQANVKVESFCIGPPRNFGAQKAFTDTAGFANLSNTCNDKQKIEIQAFPPNRKEQCGDDVSINVNDAKSVGFISNPSSAGGIWCPTKVSKTLKPVPGQVIMFVKRPTWYQSHVAG
jgi:hypothetical protein